MEAIKKMNVEAQSLQAGGKYVEAEAANRQVAVAKAPVFGAWSPQVFRSLAIAVDNVINQGRYADGEAEARVLCAQAVRVLGGQHQETLSILRVLAEALYKQ